MKHTELLKKRIKVFPSSCGVYLMKDIKGRLIYVGKALNLKSRVRSYFSDDKSFKNTFLVPRVRHIDYILTDTEVEAYLLEAGLVKKHKPRYNIRLKDDKAYPYIRCSMEDDFPRFYLERKLKHKHSLYFGPYTTAGFARRMIQFLNTRFKIRDCSNHFMKSRTKPCLTYHIGHCPAPCVHKVGRRIYLQKVRQALSFLKGTGKDVLKDMEKEMKKLSRKEHFESAARLRDSIKAIEFCRAKGSVVSHRKKNLDVVAFYKDKKTILFQTLHIRAGVVTGQRFYDEPHINNPLPDDFCSFIIQYYMDNLLPELILLSPKQIKGLPIFTLEKTLSQIQNRPVTVRAHRGPVEKKLMSMALKTAQSRFQEQYSKKQSLMKGLMEIQKKFRLKKLPLRMECFDVSHFQGQNQVAGQAVFEEGLPKKEDYRRYKIKTVTEGADDFSAIKEALDRRFRHKEYPDPHLLVVDGGKGQLNKALLALKEAEKKDIPVTAIAKARVKSDFSSKRVLLSRERCFLPGRKNAVLFSSGSEALRILTHLRDEAHRFAISYHRRLSQKSLLGKHKIKKKVNDYPLEKTADK